MLFEEMPLRDSFPWNALLLGCLVKREHGIAFGYFKQMYSLKVKTMPVRQRYTHNNSIMLCRDEAPLFVLYGSFLDH
jgi:hypothetical protein